MLTIAGLPQPQAQTDSILFRYSLDPKCLSSVVTPIDGIVATGRAHLFLHSSWHRQGQECSADIYPPVMRIFGRSSADDSGAGALEIVGAMMILSASVLLIGVAIFARADSNERAEMARSTRRVAVDAIGQAEERNCAGWGLWQDEPIDGNLEHAAALTLHQVPECAPPGPQCDPPNHVPSCWVSDSALDDHAALIGIHWTVVEREWSPVVVGFSDYYQLGGRQDCDMGAEPRPVRRVVAASRYGGLPAGVDGSDGWSASDGAAMAASMAAAPDEWEIAVTFADGPPLPKTSGWVVWQHTPADGGDWDHHWDEANVWRPAHSDMASRSVFIAPANIAYTHPDHSGLTSPYQTLPNSPPTELEVRVQGRRNPLNSSCWVLAMPAGCLGTQASTVGGDTAWTWRKVDPGQGIEMQAATLYGDPNYRSEVGIMCGDFSPGGAVGIARTPTDVLLPSRPADSNRADSRAGQSLLADDPPLNQRPQRPAAAYIQR